MVSESVMHVSVVDLDVRGVAKVVDLDVRGVAVVPRHQQCCSWLRCQ